MGPLLCAALLLLSLSTSLGVAADAGLIPPAAELGAVQQSAAGGGARPSVGGTQAATGRRRAEIGALADALKQLERGGDAQAAAHQKIHEVDQKADTAAAEARKTVGLIADDESKEKTTIERAGYEAEASDPAAAAEMAKLRSKSSPKTFNQVMDAVKEARVGAPKAGSPLGFVSDIANVIRNTLQAQQAWDEHGGTASVNIPQEFEDAEVGTNAWPVPSWWGRVPGWRARRGFECVDRVAGGFKKLSGATDRALCRGR